MQKNNPWILPEKTQAKVTSAYWDHKPSRREAILKEIQRAEAKIDREKGKIVGRIRDFEYLFSPEAKTVILCLPCFKDKTPRNERKDWESITKEEYYDKELVIHLCRCTECEKKLID